MSANYSEQFKNLFTFVFESPIVKMSITYGKYNSCYERQQFCH